MVKDKKVKVHKTDLSKLRARRKAMESSGGGGDNRNLKLVEGSNVIRVLPPWNDEGIPYKEFFQHQINSDLISALTGRQQPDDARFTVTCRKAMADEQCPVCEYIDELEQTGKRTAMKLARLLFPQQRICCNCLMVIQKDIQGNKIKGDPTDVKIFYFGKSIYEPLLDFGSGEDEEVGEEAIDITDPETGRNVNIKRTGQKKKTRYKVTLNASPSPIKLSVLKKLHNLDGIVEEGILEYREMQQALQESAAQLIGGMPSGGDEDLDEVMDDDDEDEAPPKTKKKTFKLKK